MARIAEPMPNWLNSIIILYTIIQLWLITPLWGGIIGILSRPISIGLITIEIALIWLFLKLIYYFITKGTPKPTGASAWHIKAIVTLLLINISLDRLSLGVMARDINTIFLIPNILSVVLAFKIRKQEASQGRIITFRILTVLMLLLNFFYFISGK